MWVAHAPWTAFYMGRGRDLRPNLMKFLAGGFCFRGHLMRSHLIKYTCNIVFFLKKNNDREMNLLDKILNMSLFVNNFHKNYFYLYLHILFYNFVKKNFI